MSRVDHWASVRDRSFVAVRPKAKLVGRAKKPKPAPEPTLRQQIQALKIEMAKRESELALLRDEGDVEVDKLCASLAEEGFEAAGPSLGHRIAKAVAKKHGITFTDMISARRSRDLVIARQEAMWLMRHYTTLSMPQIANILGGRDHTTVLHGVKAHERRWANG